MQISYDDIIQNEFNLDDVLHLNNVPSSLLININNKRNKISKNEILSIITQLKLSLSINISLQIKCKEKYKQLEDKQSQIETLLDKIKHITKSKPKKHVKYPSYLPLEHLYYYTSKRIHFYYQFLDSVISSSKKNQKDDQQEQQQSLIIHKHNTNRYEFTKEEDSLFKSLLLLTDNNSSNSFNWFSISEQLNKLIRNNSINNNNNTPKIFTPLKCYVRYLETTSFYKYKKWTHNEDLILKKAILYYGPKNWQQISYCLDGRNNSQCFHRWMKGINPKIKRDKWTYNEDLTLGIALTKIYGFKKWSKIANHLPGRTDIQCRERWCNILDPSLEEVEWTHEEDIRLLNMNREYGNKWSKIAKAYGNRTDNTCWRRWKFLTGSSGMVGVDGKGKGYEGESCDKEEGDDNGNKRKCKQKKKMLFNIIK